MRTPAVLALAIVACAPAPTPAPSPATAPAPAVPAAAAPVDTTPAFPIRGIVEGFYGPPWSHQDRLDMLAFMGTVGMNAYFYAPKDDPYHRERWRDPYPAQQIARIGELVETGRRNGVDVWFAISPGLSMRYSDSTDYATLMRKLDAVAAVGVRHVALYVDDVPEILGNPQDRARFPTLAHAHGAIIRSLARDLAARGIALSVVPTTYTNSFGSREYLRILGQEIPRDITLGWTGTDVVPVAITAADARAWSHIMGRKPLVWDNYPVNDFARWRLFLGPLRGRGADLATVTSGFYSNPMNEAHASMLPLWTIADYLRSPRTYDPDRSLQRALVALYGEQGAPAMRAFVDVYGDDWPTPSPIEPLFVASDRVEIGRAERAVREMTDALGTIRELAKADSARWAPLVRELAPFADSAGSRLADAYSDTMYVADGEGILRYRRELERVTAERMRRPPTLDGDHREWASLAWRRLFARGDRPLDARAAFAADDSTLYVAVSVADANVTVFGGDSVSQGDNVAVVLGGPDGAPRMTGDDVILFATPTAGGRMAAVQGRTLALTPFFQDIIVAREGYAFPEFLLTNFTDTAASRGRDVAARARIAATRDARGYRIELAIPRAAVATTAVDGRATARIALLVSDARPAPRRTASLGYRNYPANPATYTEVVLP